MSKEPSPRPRSPLAVVLLALLAEQPMHPYRMQQLIKGRGKDRIANVAQPNSVYQTIDRLLRDGLIAVHATDRAERRPGRTAYAITDLGRQTLHAWMRTILSTPAREFPDFPVALASLPLLEPDDVRQLLEARAEALATRLAELQPPAFAVPRLFLIEDEYQLAVTRAELDWVRSVIEDLAAGRLTWSEQWAREYA